MTLSIERASEADIEQLLPLLQQLFALEADFSFNPEHVSQGLAAIMQQPERAVVLVARSEKSVVGMCSAQLVISTAEGGLSAWVEDVVVDQGFRGRGVGTMLLDRLAQWCQQHGVRRMQLVADRDNRPALEFYRRSGWQATNLEVLQRR